MRTTIQTFLEEPRVPNPPRRVWRDWVLVGLIVPTAILEGIFRADHVSLRPIATVLVVAIALLLLWRRTHPFETFAVAFGSVMLFDIVAVLFSEDPIDNYSLVFVLIFVYSLFRWGSGREAMRGFWVCVAITVLVNSIEFVNWSDVIGGAVVLALPALSAGFVRYQQIAREQSLAQTKIQERSLIARDLHDTVAHHVSAIAIQAQAGRFLARSESLEGAADALEVIEEEASRALTEMRSMISVLRDADAPAALAPQHGIADIESLARTFAHESPTIKLTVNGNIDEVRPAVSSAVYRLVQESITNAIKHGKNASKIEAMIDAQEFAVELKVTDDGDRSSNNSNKAPGFGLIGMQERATLLGGTFEAGRRQGRGWRVHSILPLDGKQLNKP